MRFFYDFWANVHTFWHHQLQYPRHQPFFAMAEVETTRRSLPRQTKKAENQKEEEENKEQHVKVSARFLGGMYM